MVSGRHNELHSTRAPGGCYGVVVPCWHHGPMVPVYLVQPGYSGLCHTVREYQGSTILWRQDATLHRSSMVATAGCQGPRALICLGRWHSSGKVRVIGCMDAMVQQCQGTMGPWCHSTMEQTIQWWKIIKFSTFNYQTELCTSASLTRCHQQPKNHNEVVVYSQKPMHRPGRMQVSQLAKISIPAIQHSRIPPSFQHSSISALLHYCITERSHSSDSAIQHAFSIPTFQRFYFPANQNSTISAYWQQSSSPVLQQHYSIHIPAVLQSSISAFPVSSNLSANQSGMTASKHPNMWIRIPMLLAYQYFSISACQHAQHAIIPAFNRSSITFSANEHIGNAVFSNAALASNPASQHSAFQHCSGISFAALQHSTFPAILHSSIPVFQYSSIQPSAFQHCNPVKHFSMPPCHHFSIPMCRNSSIPSCQNCSIPSYQISNIPVFQHVSIQEQNCIPACQQQYSRIPGRRVQCSSSPAFKN